MSKKRSIMNMAINKPAEFVHFMMNDYLNKNGFVQKQVNGEMVWQHGIGALTAPKFLNYTYVDGWIHIEAWTKVAILPGVYGSEMDLDGGYGFAVKAAFKDELNRLIALLNQPLPSDSPYQQPVLNLQPVMNQQPDAVQPNVASQPVMNAQPVINGQPMNGQPIINNQPMNGQPYVSANPIPVITTDNKGKATAALIVGIFSIPLSFFPILGIILGSTGIALSGPGKHSSKKGFAIAGRVCGIIGLVLGILFWILNMVSAFIEL